MEKLKAEAEKERRTPARIYNWMHSQLSVARYYGGCSYNGADYVIAYSEEGQPLKRVDKSQRKKRGTPEGGSG